MRKANWSRLWVPTARNIAWIVVSLLLVIIFVETLFLTLWVHYSVLDSVAITGWVIGIISLVLYLLDAFSVDPVFLRIYHFPTDKTPREFEIQATVSNEGGMKIRSCQVEVRAEGGDSILLNRVIVEGLKGAVMAEPPNHIINDFPLFSRRPVQLRGYITAPDNTRVTLVIKVGRARVKLSPVTFRLTGEVVDLRELNR